MELYRLIGEAVQSKLNSRQNIEYYYYTLKYTIVLTHFFIMRHILLTMKKP